MFIKSAVVTCQARMIVWFIWWSKLEADILCEGHFGIYSPASEVRRYIESYLQQYR